jgi:hypothetical protein
MKSSQYGRVPVTCFNAGHYQTYHAPSDFSTAASYPGMQAPAPKRKLIAAPPPPPGAARAPGGGGGVFFGRRIGPDY